MAALLALFFTFVTTVIVLIADLLTNRRVGQLLLAPFEHLPFYSPIWVTILSISLVYWLWGRFFGGVVRATRGLAETGAPRGRVQRAVKIEWVQWIDDSLRQDTGWWPLGLASIVGITIAAALPSLLYALFSPEAWTLFALIGVTLIWLYFDREALQQLPPPVATRLPTAADPARHLTPAEVLAHLRASPRNRGQIRAVRHAAARMHAPPTFTREAAWLRDMQPGSMLHSILIALGINGPQELYLHQVSVLEKMLAPPDGAKRWHAMMATGPGSGRRLTAFLVLMDRTLRRGGHALVVTPDAHSLAAERQRFQQMAYDTQWQYAVYEDVLDANPDTPPPSPPPEILFCTLETLHNALLRNHKGWTEYFAGLDLVVTHEIDRYTGVVGANAAQVFRRLRMVATEHGQHLQFLATSRPADNMTGFATALFSLASSDDDVFVEASEATPRPEQIAAIWLPPLDNVIAGQQVMRMVARQPQRDAAVDLAETLLRLPDYRLLIHWYAPERGVDGGLRAILATRLGRPLPESEERLTITTNEDDLRAVQDRYDGLIILGAPPRVSEIGRLMVQLGARRGGGLGIVLAAPSPYAMRLVRGLRPDTREPVQSLGPLLPLDPDHPEIVAKHLACALAEADWTDAAVAAAFGDAGKQAIHDWLGAGRISATEELTGRTGTHTLRRLHLAQDADEDVHRACTLDTVGMLAEVEFVKRADGVVVLRSDAAHSVSGQYPGRVVTDGDGQQYQLALARTGYIAQPLPGLLHERIVPLYAVTAHLPKDAHAQNFQPRVYADGAPVGIYHHRLAVTQRLLATWQPEAREGVTLDAPPESELLTDALLITGPGDAPDTSPDPATKTPFTLPVAQTLARLIDTIVRGILPPWICATEIQVVVVPGVGGLTDQPCVLIFDTVADGIGITAHLAAAVRDVLTEAYRMLVLCPCRDGCVGCSHDPDARTFQPNYRQDRDGDKRATLRFLGAALGRDARRIAHRDPDALDKIRYVILDDSHENADDDLLSVRHNVLRYGLDPIIGEIAERDYVPAPVRFMTFAECEGKPGVAGFFRHGDDVREVALRPDVEEEIVGVMAHEYAHDWQFRAGPDGEMNMHPVLADAALGIFFSEGFAQWIEMRVLDGYAFREDADAIVYGGVNPYGEGFQIIKGIENESGVLGVLAFMREPADAVRHLLSPDTISRITNARNRDIGGAAVLVPPDVIIEPPKQPEPSRPAPPPRMPDPVPEPAPPVEPDVPVSEGQPVTPVEPMAVDPPTETLDATVADAFPRALAESEETSPPDAGIPDAPTPGAASHLDGERIARALLFGFHFDHLRYGELRTKKPNRDVVRIKSDEWAGSWQLLGAGLAEARDVLSADTGKLIALEAAIARSWASISADDIESERRKAWRWAQEESQQTRGSDARTKARKEVLARMIAAADAPEPAAV